MMSKHTYVGALSKSGADRNISELSVSTQNICLYTRAWRKTSANARIRKVPLVIQKVGVPFLIGFQVPGLSIRCTRAGDTWRHFSLDIRLPVPSCVRPLIHYWQGRRSLLLVTWFRRYLCSDRSCLCFDTSTYGVDQYTCEFIQV
jgi:hypothetical protein